MDRRSAEVVAQILGGVPVEVTPGNWQIAMPDEDGVPKLLSFEPSSNDGETGTDSPRKI